MLFGRPEEGFYYLTRETAALMIEQGDEAWYSDPLGEGACGRGINLQIEVGDVSAVRAVLAGLGVAPVRDLNERVYRTPEGDAHYLEFMAADPDGYRLRFMQLTRIVSAAV